MIRADDAANLVERFFEAYLVRRDRYAALACLADEIQWVGTGKSEMIYGRVQAEMALQAEFTEMPESCRIEYESMEESIPSDNCAVVQLTAFVFPQAENISSFWLRVSATCVVCRDGVCRIASLHASTPDSRQDEGDFFPASPMERTELEREMESKALDILGKNIPGGMMGGYLEPDFPLYYVNDYMLAYLGFTYDEFAAAIGGKVINCMHPDDRARVNTLVEDAFGKDMSYEVQYRMLKKDGGYIWVNDVGKKGVSEDGRAICISVIRDITVEVEARERLERQAAEQQRQAVRYDSLFQSVMCGIVQYRINGSRINFKNANREAIHIFGYTPEEFWTKTDWDLPDMIAEKDRFHAIEEIMRLKHPGDTNAFEFRMIQKNGTTRWIIGNDEVIVDSDGEQLIQSVFLDIDDRKKAEQRSERLAEQIEASYEVLHLALEHTTTAEFFYYPQDRLCMIPKRTSAIYRCRDRYEKMPEGFAMEQVDEAFHPAFYGMYTRIHEGEHTASCEYRGAGGDFWCRETLSVIRSDGNEEPQLVVGIVEDITRQKEMERALDDARTRDSLTGLYNKECGIGLIKRYLDSRPSGEHGVLMLLDMDDFGAVTKKEGGLFADSILQEVADILKEETGTDDIKTRLGGDEFMLFFKHSDKAHAAVNGPRIAGRVQNILADTERDVHISVSIGMCSTEVVGEYNALYRCAESTLKYVKEHGKGKAACYLDTSNELGVFLTQIYTGEHSVNAIEPDTLYAQGDLVSFALDLLGKSKNLDDAVFLLLSRIGRIYGFDRVSIIEADRAYLSWHFSYQWARNRADLQLGQDFYVSEEDFDICAAMYDEDGLADHNVRDGISHIASCIHSGIWNYGEYVGSMSFEVNQEGFQWTKEHRKLLKELVRIVPSFIMKSKADAVSQAKTDFLSRMSHEIRTPMNAISGMTTIAKNAVNDPARIRDCLNKIESSNVYLLNLINDILDMSRIESGKMELSYSALDLTALLGSLESLFQAQAMEKGLALRLQDGRREKRLIRADGLRINQVLVNIIGNAVKFTDRGSITVRVEELEAEPRAILRFSVTDTGIGIEQAALYRIFNPFEQAETGTPACRGGTGLGLSISYHLVQMMGGILEVHSEVNRGSEFFFTLGFDYMPEEESVTGEPAQEMREPDFHGRRVLLAEDNELNQEIARTLLEMNGFTVECASNGQEALDLYCGGEAGWFDAILMDIRMPVMDGLEATRRIRTSSRPDARSIPVIALSANAFDEDMKKSMANGMNGHLSKPIDIAKLLDVLEQCMRDGVDSVDGK